MAVLYVCESSEGEKNKKIKYSQAVPVRIHHSALFFSADISTFLIIADIVMTLIRYHINVLPCINYPLCLRVKVEYGFFPLLFILSLIAISQRVHMTFSHLALVDRDY